MSDAHKEATNVFKATRKHALTCAITLSMVLAPEAGICQFEAVGERVKLWVEAVVWLWGIIVLAALLKALIARFILGKKERASMKVPVVAAIIEILIAPIAMVLAACIVSLIITLMVIVQHWRFSPDRLLSYILAYPWVFQFYFLLLVAALLISIADVQLNIVLTREKTQSLSDALKAPQNSRHEGLLSLVMPVVCLTLIVILFPGNQIQRREYANLIETIQRDRQLEYSTKHPLHIPGPRPRQGQAATPRREETQASKDRFQSSK
jgi:hypothetical protein